MTHVPLRRESINDHVATARAFLERQGVHAKVSRPWVRDLVHEELLDGPASSAKPTGRGRQQRFAPRAYRDLIEITRLRAEGAIHRSTWRVCLWLRGRDYSITAVRGALASDLRRTLKTIRDEVAPTGRFGESFAAKYRRNIAPKMKGNPFPEFAWVAEPLATMMMRPQDQGDVPFDVVAFTAFVADALGVATQTIESAVAAAMSASADDMGTSLGAFAAGLPESEFSRLLSSVADEPEMLVQPPQLAGLMDNGFGGSGLMCALDATSDDRLLAIRELVRNIRTGRVERAFRDAAEGRLPDDANALMSGATWARLQRQLLRGNPKIAAYIFCAYLIGDGPPIPPPRRNRIDVDGFLEAWRDSKL